MVSHLAQNEKPHKRYVEIQSEGLWHKEVLSYNPTKSKNPIKILNCNHRL